MRGIRWVIIWIMLEVNTIIFCVICEEKEISLKYFVIQRVGSGGILISVITQALSTKLTDTLLLITVISIIIKIASSPFQEWFITIIKTIKVKIGYLLITWQKIAPIYLLTYQKFTLMIPFIVLSVIYGSFMQLNKSITIEIIGYSSVFNLRWMVISLKASFKTFVTFNILYWISLLIIISMIINNVFFSIKFILCSKQTNIIISMLIFNMGGMPPILNFLSKWVVIKEIVKINVRPLTILILLIGSINIYVYIRMSSKIIINQSTHVQYASKDFKKKELIIYLIVLFSPTLIAFL
jgi:NADH:ubiquinone oxidoreductase subunit 2 (subunit N)